MIEVKRILNDIHCAICDAKATKEAKECLSLNVTRRPSLTSESVSVAARGKPTAVRGESTALCGLPRRSPVVSVFSGLSWR